MNVLREVGHELQHLGGQIGHPLFQCFETLRHVGGKRFPVYFPCVSVNAGLFKPPISYGVGHVIAS